MMRNMDTANILSVIDGLLWQMNKSGTYVREIEVQKIKGTV